MRILPMLLRRAIVAVLEPVAIVFVYVCVSPIRSRTDEALRILQPMRIVWSRRVRKAVAKAAPRRISVSAAVTRLMGGSMCIYIVVVAEGFGDFGRQEEEKNQGKKSPVA